MIRMRYTGDESELLAMREAALSSPQRLNAIVNQRIIPAAQKQVDARLNKAPGKVKYPFEFATAKSRRWYFANRMPPYRRTGQSLQWRLRLMVIDGQTFRIVSQEPHAAAKYVFGPRQVPGHRNTGWPDANLVFIELGRVMIQDINEVWIVVMRTPGTRRN